MPLPKFLRLPRRSFKKRSIEVQSHGESASAPITTQRTSEEERVEAVGKYVREYEVQNPGGEPVIRVIMMGEYGVGKDSLTARVRPRYFYWNSVLQPMR